MKQYALFLSLLILLFGSCTSLFQKGQNQFAGGEYQLAISTFSKVLEDDPDNKEANFYVAESYRLSNRIEKSQAYYEKLVEEEESFESYYRLGQSYKSQGKYEEAEKAFSKAKDLTLDDNFQRQLDLELNSLKSVEDIEDYFPYLEVENYSLLNTSGTDYSPVFSEGFIYFTSSRTGGGIYPATGVPYTKIYRARADGIKVDVQNVQEMPEFRNEDGLNQGAIAISPDGNTIVYARGNSRSNRDLPDVHLFASYFRGGGFTQPIWMPVNEDEFWFNSTPAFSPDGEVLYFTSNRDGGRGGLDLYKATKLANGDFGNAVNLGPQINTPGNEMFPYVAPDGKLFFASDGHPGFGKLDIFVAEQTEKGWEVKNLGPNVNTIADDFGIHFTKYPTEGFLSSNRAGGEGDDDIYYFEDKTPKPKIVNVLLNVTTKEKKDDGSEETLPQTRVVLYDQSNKNIGGDFSNQSGRLRFTLTPNQTFSLIASKTGYFTKTVNYSTVGKTPNPEDLIQDVTNIVLDTTIVLDPLILERSIVLDNIYYDLDKADIRPDAAQELDKLVQILKDNPSIRIELSSHTDARATDAYNDALSQRRAESAVAYIVSQGIDEDRLVAKGYGKRQLIIENAQTEEDHQVNRRTEFKVIELLD
ncbi:OmpA family protein [Mongoliibacter ruber]|uniref:Outer membrane protein OmpA-like peptidoglycan-associated protein n=1 Tax=Mongoliibacter ruber TaxID=1750599 RepID=A0A2T0WS79_9BACT|nr:OmpA family protein [Mongoliibacter ruber]PRY89559.1 outer membrane protein OmpA-like peptidoglycan-associated protein [Mongoliibacter ruber]